MDSPPVQGAPHHYGWQGSLKSFLATPAASWLGVQIERHRASMLVPADDEQVVAWKNCFPVMHEAIAEVVRQRPEADEWSLVFEFELPRERGRRPDVVILARSAILVLEFKDSASPLQAYIDQAAAYARDLQHYHAASHDRPIHSLLELTTSTNPPTLLDGVWIGSPGNLAGEILDSTEEDAGKYTDLYGPCHMTVHEIGKSIFL